jgi:hypothetical protein
VIVIDAISYLIDAALNASVRVDEPRPAALKHNNLRREMYDGLKWTYSHLSVRVDGAAAAVVGFFHLVSGSYRHCLGGIRALCRRQGEGPTGK